MQLNSNSEVGSLNLAIAFQKFRSLNHLIENEISCLLGVQSENIEFLLELNENDTVHISSYCTVIAKQAVILEDFFARF